MKTLPFVLVLTALTIAVPAESRQVNTETTVQRGAMDPAISPDGSTVAVSILGKIWLIPIEGGAARQLTDGLGWDRYPKFSPDGRSLAYAHKLPSGTSLVIRNMESGLARVIHHVGSSLGPFEFAPNGGGLFFVNEENQYASHIWKIDLDGSDLTQLTYTNGWHEWSFALSPAGDSVLFDSGRFGTSDLYVMELETGNVERLTRTPEHEFSVGWTANGDSHVFVRGMNGVDQVIVQATADGSERTVFTAPYDQKQLALSQDGNLAVVAGSRRLTGIDLTNGQHTDIPFTASFATTAPASRDVAVVGARIFTGNDDELTAPSTVIVRDGRITEIRRGNDVPSGMTVIDGTGKTLMPGMMDNHYHYWSPNDGERLIARGITAVRDPGVAISESMSFKDAINLGLLTGPDIFSAGPLIDGEQGYHPRVDVTLTDPQAAAALVRALHEQGVDALKTYFMLEPAVLRAVVREANALGIPVTGHIGVRTGWTEAMDAGINGFSHLRVWKDFLEPEQQPQGLDLTLDGSRNPTARMQSDWRDIDPDAPETQALIQRMVESGVSLDATLAIQKVEDDARSRFSPELFTVGRNSYQLMGRLVKHANDAGVPLLAGTDNIHLVDELEAYAEFGIPAADILRAATVNGARWIGHADEFGTIDIGKRANLLLVDGDPLEDVGVLRNVVAVVKDGVVMFER